MKLKLRVLPVLLLCSCASFTTWEKNPDTAAAGNFVANGIAAYISGNMSGAVVDGLSAAAALYRSLQGTPKATSPSAVATATASAGVSPAVATIVNTGIQIALSKGATPSAANEAAAAAIDKATLPYYP